VRISWKERGSEKAQVDGGGAGVEGMGGEEDVEDGVEEEGLMEVLLVAVMLLMLVVFPLAVGLDADVVVVVDVFVAEEAVRLRDCKDNLEVEDEGLLRFELYELTTGISRWCSFGDVFLTIDDDEDDDEGCCPWGVCCCALDCRSTVRADDGADAGPVRSMEDAVVV